MLFYLLHVFLLLFLINNAIQHMNILLDSCRFYLDLLQHINSICFLYIKLHLILTMRLLVITP